MASGTQPAIDPGKTWVYEFQAQRPGTFMYHPHADEMTQMAMGMMGAWITHPRGRNPLIERVERDFVFLLNAYDVDPGSATPRIMTMLDFNLWSWNSRVFPGIDPLVVRHNDRVRIRVGNLTMTNHPIHLHGHTFTVTGTDGGAIPKLARWPEVTTDIGVGQMRQIEFVADAPGDWAIHCHKSHHTMNAMGHEVPTMIGVDTRGVAEQLSALIPDYMMMGDKGMEEMARMPMPLPENTLPMMTGEGPFGPVGMGGMFSVLKVRADQPPGDYRDPGWYAHPEGSRAREAASAQAVGSTAEPLAAPPVARAQPTCTQGLMPACEPASAPVHLKIRRPGIKS
jgi:manganese oxidase